MWLHMARRHTWCSHSSVRHIHDISLQFVFKASSDTRRKPQLLIDLYTCTLLHLMPIQPAPSLQIACTAVSTKPPLTTCVLSKNRSVLDSCSKPPSIHSRKGYRG